MQTIQIALPESIRINPCEIQLILAVKLHEQGTLFLGQAAGYSKRTFMEVLGEYGVFIFNYAPARGATI